MEREGAVVEVRGDAFKYQGNEHETLGKGLNTTTRKKEMKTNNSDHIDFLTKLRNRKKHHNNSNKVRDLRQSKINRTVHMFINKVMDNSPSNISKVVHTSVTEPVHKDADYDAILEPRSESAGQRSRHPSSTSSSSSTFVSSTGNNLVGANEPHQQHTQSSIIQQLRQQQNDRSSSQPPNQQQQLTQQPTIKKDDLLFANLFDSDEQPEQKQERNLLVSTERMPTKRVTTSTSSVAFGNPSQPRNSNMTLYPSSSTTGNNKDLNAIYREKHNYFQDNMLPYVPLWSYNVPVPVDASDIERRRLLLGETFHPTKSFDSSGVDVSQEQINSDTQKNITQWINNRQSIHSQAAVPKPDMEWLMTKKRSEAEEKALNELLQERKKMSQKRQEVEGKRQRTRYRLCQQQLPQPQQNCDELQSIPSVVFRYNLDVMEHHDTVLDRSQTGPIFNDLNEKPQTSVRNNHMSPTHSPQQAQRRHRPASSGIHRYVSDASNYAVAVEKIESFVRANKWRLHDLFSRMKTETDNYRLPAEDITHILQVVGGLESPSTKERVFLVLLQSDDFEGNLLGLHTPFLQRFICSCGMDTNGKVDYRAIVDDHKGVLELEHRFRLDKIRRKRNGEPPLSPNTWHRLIAQSINGENDGDALQWLADAEEKELSHRQHLLQHLRTQRATERIKRKQMEENRAMSDSLSREHVTSAHLTEEDRQPPFIGEIPSCMQWNWQGRTRWNSLSNTFDTMHQRLYPLGTTASSHNIDLFAKEEEKEKKDADGHHLSDFEDYEEELAP
eukprot:m.132374 g.132374  ORF g.132374 m.132374 type:complete len:782 (-) comp13088_c0_seq1:248-2593(-)